ncbi:hypothetical protein ACHQM5_003077 [Ranunculus cassubicifolius]
MTETCNSRGFSRLMKSCFPNTTQPEYSQQTTYLIRNSDKLLPENHQTTLSTLPDDLLLECLSRLPLSSLSSVSLVCRKWSLLIDSGSFYDIRRRQCVLRQTIFAVSVADSSFRVANHRIGCESDWEIAPIRGLEIVMPEIFDQSFSFSHSRLIEIGRHVYILSRNSTLRYDTWSGGITSRSPMIFPRKKFAAAGINGNIYVSGGAARTATVEEYTPETDTWRIVAESARRRYGCLGAAVDRVFYVIGGLKINNRAESCSQDARDYASTMDLYDVETRGWLRSRRVPGGGCVVAACAVGGHLYILTSHAVELSFWRYDGRRKMSGFGEWCRMKSPPLPAQVRVDNSVRFSCVGVGEEKGKVVLIQVLGCIDDLLRRSGRSCRGFKEGLVLVYDCEIGEWSRDLDLPSIIRRAACVCVEC